VAHAKKDEFQNKNIICREICESRSRSSVICNLFNAQCEANNNMYSMQLKPGDKVEHYVQVLNYKAQYMETILSRETKKKKGSQYSAQQS
jgi:hypothetical protein